MAVPKYRQIESGYLERWYLIPKNKRFNVMLHKFTGDDPRKLMHDHPWWFWSVCLKGELWEVTETSDGWEKTEVMPKWVPRFYRATHQHRFELPEDRKPAWTIVVTGPWRRSWGMYEKKKLVEIMSFRPD